MRKGTRGDLADAFAALLLLAPVMAWPGGFAQAPLVPTAVLLGAWIAWRDASTFTIPDAALAALAAIAALDLTRTPVFAFDPTFATASFVLEGLICGGGIFLVREVYFRRRGHDGVGFGDVKLAGVGGLLCGLQGFSVALLAASLCGLGFAALTGRLKLGEFSRKIPFGAIFAPMLLLVWLGQA